MTSLVNVKSNDLPILKGRSNFVYIGRANTYLRLDESKWHNPFPMKAEAHRVIVLRNYLDYIVQPEQKQLIIDLHELDGKVLGCYCSPRKCHGDILIKLRELQKQERIEEWETILEWIEQ